MIHTDATFSQRVEDAVARIEERTDAEVVVVAAERSGSYADLAAAGAGAVALLAFVVVLLVPFQISPVLAVVDLVVAWFAGRWLLSGAWYLRRIASPDRKDAQVREAAAAEFHLEAVHSTPTRKALLVYVSALEGRVELIPDVGLEARIPRGRWAEATQQFAHDDLDHFLAGLAAVGELLEECVPHTGAERPDLANAPRIRP